jgi:hypothetical protein
MQQSRTPQGGADTETRADSMEYVREFVTTALVGGALVVLPLYLAVLLLLKGMKAVVGLVRPIARLLPEWMPAENILACYWC